MAPAVSALKFQVVSTGGEPRDGSAKSSALVCELVCHRALVYALSYDVGGGYPADTHAT